MATVPSKMTIPAVLSRLGTSQSMLLEAADEARLAGETELVDEITALTTKVGTRIATLRKESKTAPTRHV